VVPVVYTLLARWAGAPKPVQEAERGEVVRPHPAPAPTGLPAGALPTTRGASPSP
jgi:hypothetical protein